MNKMDGTDECCLLFAFMTMMALSFFREKRAMECRKTRHHLDYKHKVYSPSLDFSATAFES